MHPNARLHVTIQPAIERLRASLEGLDNAGWVTPLQVGLFGRELARAQRDVIVALLQIGASARAIEVWHESARAVRWAAEIAPEHLSARIWSSTETILKRRRRARRRR